MKWKQNQLYVSKYIFFKKSLPLLSPKTVRWIKWECGCLAGHPVGSASTIKLQLNRTQREHHSPFNNLFSSSFLSSPLSFSCFLLLIPLGDEVINLASCQSFWLMKHLPSDSSLLIFFCIPPFSSTACVFYLHRAHPGWPFISLTISLSSLGPVGTCSRSELL